MKQVDFIIVGSIEEMDFYKNFKKNVIRFPQLEDIQLKKKFTQIKKL